MYPLFIPRWTISVFAATYRGMLSWVRWIQATNSSGISLRSSLVLPTCLHVRLSSAFVPLGLPNQYFTCILHVSNTCYTPVLSSFDHHNAIWWRALVTNFEDLLKPFFGTSGTETYSVPSSQWTSRKLRVCYTVNGTHNWRARKINLKTRTCKRATSAEDYTGVGIQLSEQVLLVCVFRHYDIVLCFGSFEANSQRGCPCHRLADRSSRGDSVEGTTELLPKLLDFIL